MGDSVAGCLTEGERGSELGQMKQGKDRGSPLEIGDLKQNTGTERWGEGRNDAERESIRMSQ